MSLAKKAEGQTMRLHTIERDWGDWTVIDLDRLVAVGSPVDGAWGGHEMHLAFIGKAETLGFNQTHSHWDGENLYCFPTLIWREYARLMKAWSALDSPPPTL